jgi:hypothetical protein
MKYLQAYPLLVAPPAENPVYLFTPEYLATVQAHAAAQQAIGSGDWIDLRNYVDNFIGTGKVVLYVDDPSDPGPTGIWAGTYQAGSYWDPLMSLAVAYMICKDGLDPVRAANYLAKIKDVLDKTTFWDRMYYNMVPTMRIWAVDYCYSIRFFCWLPIVYSWVYPHLTQSEKDQIIRVCNQYLDYFYANGAAGPLYPYGGIDPCANYFTPYYGMLSTVGLLTAGDNPRASEYETFWHDKMYLGPWLEDQGCKPWLDVRGKGGGTWEGEYSGNAEPHHWLNAICEKTAGGLDQVADGHTWLLESVKSHLYLMWPSRKTKIPSDLVSRYGFADNTPRPWWTSLYMAPYMLRLFGETTLAAQMQQFVIDTAASGGIVRSDEIPTLRYLRLMYWDYNGDVAPYNTLPLSYLAEGMGWVTSRSSWDTTAVQVFLKGGALVETSGHNEPGNVTIEIVKENTPLVLQPSSWLLGHNSHPLFMQARELDSPSGAPGTGKYFNNYYPYIPGVTTSHGCNKWGIDKTRPAITIYKEATDYMFLRNDFLQDHYLDGTANTSTGKLCKDFTREVIHLRPNYVLVYDRTTRGVNATNEMMQFHCDIPTQVLGQPSGTTRWDITCRTTNDFTTTFVGGIQTLFPNGSTVSRTSIYTELGAGGEALASDATGRVRDATSPIATWAGDIGDTLTITSAGTGFVLGEYTVTDVDSNRWATLTPTPTINCSEGGFTLNRRTISASLKLLSDATGKVAIHVTGNPVKSDTYYFLYGFKGSYITIWGAGSGFTTGTRQVTSISPVDGYATLATNPGNNKTGGWWHLSYSAEGSRDCYRLAIVPPSGPTNTWLTAFQAAASSGAITAAKAFSGTGYEGCEVGTWAVVFPKNKTGYGNPPTYTVTTTLLRHLVTGLIPNSDYQVICKNAGGTTRRTLTPASSAEGILDFTATTDEVRFEVTSVVTLSFENVTSDTGLQSLWDSWKSYSDSQGYSWWPAALAVGNFKNDDKPSLVLSHHGGPPGSRIFTNTGLNGNGNPQFSDNTATDTLSGSFNLMSADGAIYTFSKADSGSVDLIALSNEGLGAYQAINNGSGKWDVSNLGWSFPMLNFFDANNGEGRVDVVGLLSSANAPGISVYRNNGSGSYTQSGSTLYGEYIAFTPAMEVAGMAGLTYRFPMCRKVNLGGTYGEVVIVTMGEDYTFAYQKTFILKLVTGTYVDVTESLGLPVTSPSNGHVLGVFDANEDGLLDLLVTSGPAPGIYINDGAGHLVRQLDELATDLSSAYPETTLEGLFDFNENGKPDLVLTGFRFGYRTRVYENKGGYFVRSLGFYTAPSEFAVALAIADFNNDGRLDIAALTTNGPRLYLNRTTAAGNWINVKLTSPPSYNVLGIDAIVEVYEAGHLDEADHLLARVRNNTPGSPARISVGGIGCSLGSKLPIHVGLGSATSVDVRVTYPKSGGGSPHSDTALAQSTNQTISM